MNVMKTNNGTIVKSWLAEDTGENKKILAGVMEQVENLSLLPGIHRHIAIMPDGHIGFGMPIGGVLATDGIVIPNAVGVDIGCGMRAAKTTIRFENEKDQNHFVQNELKKIMSQVRATIPVGFGKRDKVHPSAEKFRRSVGFIGNKVDKNSMVQLGTLGGGNHFIEFQHDTDGFLWVMIHSGSRNLGKQVADYYHKAAKEMCAMWKTGVPKDLAYFPADSDEGMAYLHEMRYCVEYAAKNREIMMDEAIGAIIDVARGATQIEFDVPHNYAAIENHFGKNVWVHRKGATRARDGERGIIPGSQGSASFIVQGLGNPESFHSCSHGAGRALSRRQAREVLNVKKESEALDEKGILHAIRGDSDLDEAPGAYKDINAVMKQQEDLVITREILLPLGVIKG